MTISDEIRGWCDEANYIDKDERDELRDLADRIDREMVELPKDADGVPIHVGDTVYTVDVSTAYVTRICIARCKMYVKCGFSDGGGIVYDPHELSHERPDSLERIADEIEAAEGWRDEDGEYWTGISSVEESMLREWADRIRKLAKEGEHGR